MSAKSQASQKFQISPSNRYEKDVKKLAKSGLNLSKLEAVIDTLARDEKLAAKHKDHELKGALKGVRECHVAPDWLLMYQKDHKSIVLLLLRTGTHRDVLGRE